MRDLIKEKIKAIEFDYRNEEECIEAIKRYPWNIKFIENPTPEMCKTAVELDPLSIIYIDNPSEELIGKIIDNPAVFMYMRDIPKLTLSKAIIINHDILRFVEIDDTVFENIKDAIKDDITAIAFLKDKYIQKLQEYVNSIE